MIPEEITSHDLYRERYHHTEIYRKISEVASDIEYLNFWRKGNSHVGISNLKKINHLTATAVNNSFFKEICELKSLDSLVLANIDIDCLDKLSQLPNLRYLALEKLKPCDGLEGLALLPRLEKLWITESKDITDYSFIKGAKSLIAVGVEGAIWTKQKVDSLEPFSEMPMLEALFMASVQLKDKKLDYVASNPKLKYFSVARFAPKSSFENLYKIRPDLVSQWFERYDD
ncbi:leucine-rich repeat domain-containing protein [Teredinibacter purpureus]|uniref:hypothetical protein n=1 Tax=Teredinibacter purpureus TaxID=2731756 RepID=UPI0006973B7E|nr:hypothetical protein [Teredinibacter purpureus]